MAGDASGTRTPLGLPDDGLLATATLVDLACAIAAVRATGFDPSRESLVTSDMHLRYVGRPGTGARMPSERQMLAPFVLLASCVTTVREPGTRG